MSHVFKLSAISAAVMASYMAMPAIAQEAEEKADEREIEVIEVTGFKGSLRKAMNAKRFSDSVSDSIHAEDVGKSTDQNIADALSRVTGISVQEEGGEGTRISIRGAGPGLNQVSMNGVALTGGLSTDGSSADATNDNSVDLSAFSSDILSSIDVIKTAAADQDEGSLGGTVILRTVKPLDLNEPRRSFTVEGRYNEWADENDSRLNFSIADKFLDDTFGFVLTASKDTQKTRQDRIETYWESGLPIQDYGSTGRVAHEVESGKPIRVLGFQRDENDDIIYGEDGNPLLNPIESLENYDPETQYLYEGDLFVSARDLTEFGLNTDERDRFSVSTGLQWRPTDKLDIQLDLTHTEQDILTDNHTMRINMGVNVPLVHPDEDVAALNAVDVHSNTLMSSQSRSASGNFTRSYGLREVDTDVASLKVEYNFTDDFTMNFTAGYSKTTDETPDDDEDDRFISISTATWGTAGRQIVDGMPQELAENIGYDCEGKNCSYYVGETEAVFDAFDGTAVSIPSRFNPFDMQHNHLGALNLRKNKLEDESKSVFLDFDYQLDNDYITSIEFGGKWSRRNKDVHIQNRMTTNGDDLVDLEDPDAEFEVRGMGTIRLSDILSGDAFPYDNFAEDIQNDRSAAFFGGWPMLDGERALEVVAGKDAGELGIRETINGSRDIETTTKAAYFKVNFELMDGRLTGNFGTRYVKDENIATGVGGINYVRFPQMLSAYDLLVKRGLGDMSQAACPDAVMGQNDTGGFDHRVTPVNDADLQNCWAWQVTHGYNRDNDATIPYDNGTGTFLVPGADGMVGPDVNRLVFVDPATGQMMLNQLPGQIYDSNGNLVSTSANAWAHFGAGGHIWPWLDRTTAFTGPNGNQDNTYSRTAWVTNKAENEIWLPSFNLNYAINDEMIGRFAVTRTMTRPNFDSLNPRTQVNEEQWDPTGSGAAGNTALKPLESTNYDFSYEWYFNEAGMLSVALFYKDMDNFEETVQVPYHYKDVREEYDLESADLLLPFDENRTPGDADNCMPLRQVAGFFDQWRVECDVATITTVRNGEGADIKGVEFGYTQNYDFLPGIWSGLGLSFNYTYQDSESDKELIPGTGRYLKPLPQPYTPKHSANTTLFWEKDGIQLRLAHRFNDDQLVSRDATWQDATSRLDFSSSFKITDNISLTFHALNLTDDTRRIYYTPANVVDSTDPNDQSNVVLDEGNALDENVPDYRTVAEYKTGRQYRIGIRGTF